MPILLIDLNMDLSWDVFFHMTIVKLGVLKITHSNVVSLLLNFFNPSLTYFDPYNLQLPWLEPANIYVDASWRNFKVVSCWTGWFCDTNTDAAVSAIYFPA